MSFLHQSLRHSENCFQEGTSYSITRTLKALCFEKRAILKKAACAFKERLIELPNDL